MSASTEAPCPVCEGRGIRVTKGDVQAEASFCDCVGTCAECGGDGWIHERRESGYTVAIHCVCASRTQRIALFNAAEIPARYHDRTLDNFLPRLTNHDHIMEYIEVWMRGFAEHNTGLLFFGAPGLGKTHLALSVLRQLVTAKSVRGRFIEFGDLLALIRGSFGNRGQDGKTDVLRSYQDAALLVVDELGKGKGTEWELSILDQLIGDRYNRELTTIFTTHYPLQRTDQVQERDGMVELRPRPGARGGRVASRRRDQRPDLGRARRPV